MQNVLHRRDESILVLDSGNGGKYTLNLLEKRLPNEHFTYFEDDRNSPYGNKSKFSLKKIIKKDLDFMLKNYPIKALVLAYNTLSACTTNYIKKLYKNLVIVSTLPITKIRNKMTLIIYTTATKKYSKLLKNYIKNKLIKILSFDDLAKKIDENMQNLDFFTTIFE